VHDKRAVERPSYSDRRGAEKLEIEKPRKRNMKN
jgi:hypothetical protein